jgi:hypothetical protein
MRLESATVLRGTLWAEGVNAVTGDIDLDAIRESVRRDRPFGTSGRTIETAKPLNLEYRLRPRGRPRRNEPGGNGENTQITQAPLIFRDVFSFSTFCTESLLVMTLLIALGAESAIHHSSDYRLSHQGKVTETSQGTKQLSVNSRDWNAHIAFTGIATDGEGYSTMDWLGEEGVSPDPASSPAVFAGNVARRGTEELKRVAKYDRRLTILLIFATIGRCRLFLVSNFEERGMNPLTSPMDKLRYSEIGLSRPVVQACGASGSLQRSEKKHLLRLFINNLDSKALRIRIAEANRRAAMRPGYGNIISQGCSVTSVFADGHYHSENYGEVQGIPRRVMPGFDMSAYLINTLLPAIEKRNPLVRSAPVCGRPNLLPRTETRESREIQISTPTTVLEGIGQADDSRFPRLEFAGLTTAVNLRKNVWVAATLNTVTFEIDPTKGYEGAAYALERQLFANVPMVDGARPINWHYVFDMHVAGGTAVISIRQSSLAMRPTNFSAGLDAVGPGEELLMVASSCEPEPNAVTDTAGNTYIREWVSSAGAGLILTAQPGSTRVTAEIKARFLLRDCAT